MSLLIINTLEEDDPLGKEQSVFYQPKRPYIPFFIL